LLLTIPAPAPHSVHVQPAFAQLGAELACATPHPLVDKSRSPTAGRAPAVALDTPATPGSRRHSTASLRETRAPGSQSPTPQWLPRIHVTSAGDCCPGLDVVTFPVHLPRSPPRAERARGVRNDVVWLPRGRHRERDTTAATLAAGEGRLPHVHAALY